MCYRMTMEEWQELSYEEREFISKPQRAISWLELDRDPLGYLSPEEREEIEALEQEEYEAAERAWNEAMINGEVEKLY